MKPFLTMLAFLATFTFSSCNNATDKGATTTEVDTAAKTVEAAPAFEPFKLISISHTVKDFDAWKKEYDGHASMRAANGISELALARGLDNPNKVYVFNKIADLQKAKDFSASPDLKEAMKNAGVTSTPEILFVDVLRFEDAPEEFSGRVRVGHKVKDFNAWLTVFDQEGKETRKANGLIDRALSRSIDDPSMIYITFTISDMEKAKARINDPELKKIMTEGGVISQPEIVYYTIVK